MPQIDVTTLNDGPRNAVIHVAIAGDSLGDFANEVIIDPKTSFDPALPGVPGLTIQAIHYDLTGFDAVLEWEYLTSDVMVWSMTGDQCACADFTGFGGLKDRSPSDGTGKLKLTTKGLGDGETGTFIVWVRKD